MNKTCKDCKKQFEVTDQEIQFIDKVSPNINGKKIAIPMPDLCPDCRLALRTVQRNEQYLYQTKSAASGQPLITLYSPENEWAKNLKIYSQEEWWSDKWDAIEYGKDFDFNRSFFEQFQELNLKVPRTNLMQINNENCPYTTGTGYCKNCYLINCSENTRDSYYGKLVQTCSDVLDSDYTYNSELLYQCFNVTKCYDCKYLSYSQNCSDCYFSENLKGCRNCFLCTNLNNKEFYFMNQPLSKEQYQAKIKEFIGTRENVEKAKTILNDLHKKRIYKYANIVSCENSSGDFITNSKNCTDCYDVNDSLDCKYVHVGVNVKDLMDCSNMYLKPELNYQVLGTIATYNVIFSVYIFHSQNVMYSQFCHNSKDLFGCVGLRNKKFCILNKQYTEAEYNELVPKIIEHMKKNGAWGAFFPAKTSTFGYNETVANEYLPLTREQALAKGYNWKEHNQREYTPQNYIVPSDINQVNDDILQQVISCKNILSDGKICGHNFKIIPQELKRLRSMKMPIIEKCPDCRHLDRMALRNPPKLYNRTCNKCSAAIQSTFAPNRPETVYCEKCYLGAVY